MIVLVASPEPQLLHLLCRALPVGAVLSRGRRALPGLPVPVFRQLPALFEFCPRPRATVFLSPYPNIEADVAVCAQQEIPVLSAGPVALAGTPRICWGGQHRFAPLFAAALAQRNTPEFGEAVYLRRSVGGGMGFASAWWAAWQLLEEARDLVNAAVTEVHMAACREGRQHHLALSVAFANRATAHLVVVPHHFPASQDLTLLGTGGLLTSDHLANATAVVGAEGLRLTPPDFLRPEPAWIRDFAARLDHLSAPPDPTPALRLRRALRRALRQGQIVRVES